MSATTVVRSTDIISDGECATVARWHPSAGRPQKSTTLKTKDLSRAVAGNVLVSDINVHLQLGDSSGGRWSKWGGQVVVSAAAQPPRRATGGTVLLDGQDYRAIAPREVRRRVRHGHADGISLSRDGGCKHGLRTPSARGEPFHRADCCIARSRRFVRVPGTGCGYAVRRRGSTRVNGTHSGGRTRAAPIRNFRLVVDKGSERNLVSFCSDGVRQIGPTQFEVTESNSFRAQTLQILS